MEDKKEFEERIEVVGKTVEPTEYAFWMALPDFFKTVPQKCVMSQMLWSNEGTTQLVVHMRIYDILRRLYFVQLKREPCHNEVLKCMKMVMETPELRDFLMGFAQTGTFPDTDNWKLLKNK